MKPDKLEELTQLMHQLIDQRGWNIFEQVLTKELGFRLVETRRTYRHPDGSKIVISEDETKGR